MHQIQEEIGIPKIEKKVMSQMHMIFTISPLPQGYGTTLGNALRRVLLSSLPGAAVTGVKISGVTHEYSTLKGVKDSVLDIILNLKKLHIKKISREPSIIKLHPKKEGQILAKDIETSSDVEILNKDLYITTLDSKDSKLNMEIRIEKGVGYLPASIKESEEKETEFILVDATFTPVERVRYDVEAVRVGQMTNLDKLILEIVTNGSISSDDALKFAADLLKSYFSLFNITEALIEPEFMTNIEKIAAKKQQEERETPRQEAYTPIEILGLSPRTLNALINGSIGSIEELVQCTEMKLNNLRGFGKKALTEVKIALKSRNFHLPEESSE
ncbi:DNA-directed RNA polymerase subunit alpha [Candidatus Peregrinibacteria bacterium]|nr:DNA-directed RNA polymerase subunit alpha [Candidatus Peregrinibacteria bacterium]